MSNSNIPTIDILTDTWQSVITRTNSLITSLSSEIVTANSTMGVTGSPISPRNATLFGAFSANSILINGNTFSVNSTILTIGNNLKLSANNSTGISGYVLTSGGSSGNVYWSPVSGTVRSVANGAGLLGGTITNSGTLSVNPGTGIVIDDNGVSLDTLYANNIITPETNVYDLLYTYSALPLYRGTKGVKSFARNRNQAIIHANDLSEMIGFAKYANTTGGSYILASGLTPNRKYQIRDAGSTNWNAVANTVGANYSNGTIFTCVNVGSGTGICDYPYYTVWNQSDSSTEEGSLRYAIEQAKANGGGRVIFSTKGDFTIKLNSQLLINFDNLTLDAPARNVKIGALNTVRQFLVTGKNIILRRLSLFRYPHYTVSDNELSSYCNTGSPLKRPEDLAWTAGQTVFNVYFDFEKSSEIYLRKRFITSDNDLSFVLLTEGEDYTVNVDAKTITLTSALSNINDKLSIISDKYSQGSIWVRPDTSDRVWVDQCTFTNHQSYAFDIQYANTNPTDVNDCRATLSRCQFRNSSANMSIGSGVYAQNTIPAWATSNTAILSATRKIFLTMYKNVFDGVGRRSPNVNALTFVHKINNVHILNGYEDDDGVITSPYASAVYNGGWLYSEGDYIRLGSPQNGWTARGMYAQSGAANTITRLSSAALKIVNNVNDDSIVNDPLNESYINSYTIPYSYTVNAVPTTTTTKLNYVYDMYSTTGAEISPLSEMNYVYVNKATGDAANLYVDGFNVVIANNGYRVRTKQTNPASGADISTNVSIDNQFFIARGLTLPVDGPNGNVALRDSTVFALRPATGYSTSNLVNITGGSDNQIIGLRNGTNANDVILTSGGNIAITDNIALTNNTDMVWLYYDDNISKWLKISGPSTTNWAEPAIIGSTTPNTAIFSGLSTTRTAVTSPAATDGNIFSGTYTPAIFAGNNVGTTSVSRATQYMRLGNTVSVSGTLAINPTNSGFTIFEIPLPIASNITLEWHAAGTTSPQYNNGNYAGRIYANTTSKNAVLNYYAADSALDEISFTFMYQIR
jgi:hypothetical protein